MFYICYIKLINIKHMQNPTIHSKIRVRISPSRKQLKEINIRFKNIYGKPKGYDCTPEEEEHFDKLYIESCQDIIIENVTMDQAQAFAEPFRIANPDQCITLYSLHNNSFIGNTSWNDQMKIFFEYPTYTEYGAYLAKKRKDEANAQGIQASWE